MPFNVILRRIWFQLHGRVVHLRPKDKPKGNVLISYTTLPFIDTRKSTLNAHTNRWECWYMAQSFLAHGYAVDVIDSQGSTFVPHKQYSYCIDVDENLSRLAPLLNKDCIKIFHVCTQHWQANNTAEQARLDAFEKRRGVKPQPERMITPNSSAESADVLLLLGNAETERTYAHIHKPIFRIPISTTFIYPSPEQKDFDQARRSFVWVGGAGAIHKGVDLLLEAFSQMPEYRLHLCGKYANLSLVTAYENELKLPNIILHGMLDLGGQEFAHIANESVAIISVSCAEGQEGSVVVGMHAGLIPIVGKESGIDTHAFGSTLSDTAVSNIQTAARNIANESSDRLRERALATWQFARAHHTRETFAKNWELFLGQLESGTYK